MEVTKQGERVLVSSGAPWEPRVGYSRAVRVGPIVAVAGTLASDAEGHLHHPGDAHAQAAYCLRKIAAALEAAGAGRGDVFRTRMYVTDIAHQEAVGRAHAEFFTGILPAATMVAVSGLPTPPPSSKSRSRRTSSSGRSDSQPR